MITTTATAWHNLSVTDLVEEDFFTSFDLTDHPDFSVNAFEVLV